MFYWGVRESLSLENRLRRSYYEALRDQLDQYMVRHGLIDSYHNFKEEGIDYPFVEKRELKPRAIIPDQEYESQNAFLVIFVEDRIPKKHKKYIRFFEANRTRKTNLLRSQSLPLDDRFDRYHKYFESARFFDFVAKLLPVDYALLIQRDASSRSRFRYALTHFHVRIDWPIADAAEELARHLRYISKDLYEKGEKYAEDLEKKFFEFYGLPLMAGGRRTAACVAAQYLKRIPCISTVYVGSSESRALLRFSERGPAKVVLIRIDEEEVREITEANAIPSVKFREIYEIRREESSAICLFRVTYVYTAQAKAPADGKLRELKPDLNWLTVKTQHILPKPFSWEYPPIAVNIIYT